MYGVYPLMNIGNTKDMTTISDLYRYSVINKKYGETHNIERIYETTSPDLYKLKDNQSVCWGDGRTFYFLLTEK